MFPKSAFPLVPEKPQKSPQNAEIPFKPGLLFADICSGHRKPSECESEGKGVSQTKPARKRGRIRWTETKATMADSREVMNIRQASQYLGVSPDTLYKYVGEQKIPAFKLGNRWRFKKSRLDQWMEEQSSEMEQGKRKGKAAAKAAGTL